MENDFDYKLVSSGFPHCFNDQCPQADSCLRHLAAKQSKSGSRAAAGVPTVPLDETRRNLCNPT